MVITGISTIQNTTLRLRTPNFFRCCSLSVYYSKGPWFKKVKGDDTSTKMSKMIEEVSNIESSKGWKLIQITRFGKRRLTQKVILTMEKDKIN